MAYGPFRFMPDDTYDLIVRPSPEVSRIGEREKMKPQIPKKEFGVFTILEPMSEPYSEEPIKVPRFNEESGFYTTPERSKIMGKIRGKNTKPELAFRKALYAAGYRYRVDYRKLIGRPDVVLKKYKTVVFIDGEYWHGHNWEERKQKIKTNREFWIAKIERNMQRDREVNTELNRMGYTVFRFWEGEVKKELNRCLQIVVAHLEQVKAGL